MPLGIRVTTLFLRVMVVALIFPLVALTPSCLISLAIVFAGHADALNTILLAAFSVGFFMVLLATAMGGEWMIQFLRARHSPPDALPRNVMPPHPVRRIGMPLIALLNVYAVLAVLSWLIATLGGFGPANWAWLVFWLVVALVSYLSKRWVNRWVSERETTSLIS